MPISQCTQYTDGFKHIWVSLDGSTSFLNALWNSGCCSNHSKLPHLCALIECSVAVLSSDTLTPHLPHDPPSAEYCALGEQCRGGELPHFNVHALVRVKAKVSQFLKTRLHSVSSFYLLLLFYLNYILMIEIASKKLDAFFSLSSPRWNIWDSENIWAGLWLSWLYTATVGARSSLSGYLPQLGCQKE